MPTKGSRSLPWSALAMGMVALLLVMAVACGSAAAPAPTITPLPTAALGNPYSPAAAATPTVAPRPTATAVAKPARSDVRIVLAAEPPSLDMFHTSGSEHSTIYRENMTDLISWVDQNTKKAVTLSGFTGWQQMAPDRWRFNLRPGVKFHNGEVFDAAAAVVNVDYQGEQKYATDSFSDTGPIKGQVVDPLTMDVTCSQICPIFPNAAKALGFQAPKWYTSNPKEVTSRNTIGFGPYRLAKWEPGISIRLEAYPDYVPNPQVFDAQKPVIKDVVYLFRGESSVRSAMVKTGEADLAFNIGLSDKNNVPVFNKTASGLNPFLPIDTIWNPVLKNVKVRQALAYGFNCQEIVDTIMGGATTCRGNAGFPGILGITAENVKPYGYNPERSKQLLKEAGYAGEKIRIASRDVSFINQREVMEAVANYWKALGINVELVFMESGLHRTLRNCGVGRVAGDVTRRPSECDVGDIHETSADLSSLDYSRLIYGWLSCTGPSSRVCNPELEALNNKALAATGEERRMLLEQVAGKAREEVLILGLFDGVVFIGQSADLEWQPRGIDRKIRVNTMKWKK